MSQPKASTERKLALHKETVRELVHADLEAVAGGTLINPQDNGSLMQSLTLILVTGGWPLS